MYIYLFVQALLFPFHKLSTITKIKIHEIVDPTFIKTNLSVIWHKNGFHTIKIESFIPMAQQAS